MLGGSEEGRECGGREWWEHVSHLLTREYAGKTANHSWIIR